MNPEGYVWPSAVNAAAHKERLEALWKTWKGAAVRGGGDGTTREELDPWQAFAYDIVMQKARERDAAFHLGGYEPLRMVLTGAAGSGKSRLVRAIASAVEGATAARAGEEAAEGSCVLAAPTGCASFQLKQGASTLHRSFGVPVGYCGPMNPGGERFKDLQRKMRKARLAVLDEFSMIGRIFMGKVLFRVAEFLGTMPRSYGRFVSMGGLDVVLAGHAAQIKPVGDERLYKKGAYKGKGLNKPRKG